MKRKVSDIGLWVIHLCLAGMIAGGIGELWIRAFVPVKNISYISDPLIGARFFPNQRTYGYVEKGYSNVLVTNSMGFHDIERTRKKEAGTFRIQIYGDSMIQGYCVPLDKTIPRLLERYLNDGSFPYRIEVLNMAPGEDGTSSQVMTYKAVGRDLEPDLVISYFMDDFPDNVAKIHGRPYSPYHVLESDGGLKFVPPIPKDTSTLWERFKRTSRLYRHLANRFLESKLYNRLGVLKKDFTAFMRGGTDGGELEAKNFEDYRKMICATESWPLTLRLIEHFDEVVRQDGRMFLLVEAAELYEETVGWRYSNQDFERVLESKGISYIRAYEEYSRIKATTDFDRYFFKDHHMKPVGNEEMSRFVAKELKLFLGNAEGLRPPPPLAEGMTKQGIVQEAR